MKPSRNYVTPFITIIFLAVGLNERLKELSAEEREDLGLLLLMQQSDRRQTVSREEVMNALD